MTHYLLFRYIGNLPFALKKIKYIEFAIICKNQLTSSMFFSIFVFTFVSCIVRPYFNPITILLIIFPISLVSCTLNYLNHLYRLRVGKSHTHLPYHPPILLHKYPHLHETTYHSHLPYHSSNNLRIYFHQAILVCHNHVFFYSHTNRLFLNFELGNTLEDPSIFKLN